MIQAGVEVGLPHKTSFFFKGAKHIKVIFGALVCYSLSLRLTKVYFTTVKLLHTVVNVLKCHCPVLI